MARQEEASKVPVLVAPREQSVVHADRVTFLWKPGRDVRSYRVQIATSPSFDDVIYESKALNRTEFTLRGELPPEDDTFFWRVLAEDEEGVVHGEDNIESFYSTASREAAAAIVQPDQDEDLGPLERLFRGAAAEAAAEVTHAPKWVREEDDLGVEHEGIEAGQILGFVLAIVVAIGLSVFMLYEYVDITAQAARIEATGRSGYPELRESRLQAMQRLTQYEAVDPQAERYRIPIDRAMDLMVQEAPSAQQSDAAAERDLLGLERP